MSTMVQPIRFDSSEASSCFDVRPFRVEHKISGQSLFELESLLDAADCLPSTLIECNAGDVPVSMVAGKHAGHGLTPRQIVARMSEERVWLGLKKIDLLPEYSALLEDLLTGIDECISDRHPGMYNIEGYVFISSPGTIVPYHMDTEHNFLLQIQGRKTMYTIDRYDSRVLCEYDIERYYTNMTRRMEFDSKLHELATKWDLGPGDGMHVPVTYPHYVENGDELSVSLSITFDTPRQQARARVYKVNHHLRRLGISPVPFGRSPLRDSVKSVAGIMYQKFLGPGKASWRK